MNKPPQWRTLFLYILGLSILTSIFLIGFSTSEVAQPSAAGATPIPIIRHKPQAIVTVDLTAPSIISAMSTGATHIQTDANPGNDPAAVDSAKKLMQSALLYQNQPIMGWGADNPEPAPDKYNWQSLDQRVQLMRDTHAKMVLTLCGAPGWMRPAGYQDDWKYLETAPDPAHVPDFARLAVTIAQRYPDVLYFQVWNEMKGMWSADPGATAGLETQNRWDYERYTTLYNTVYDAVHKVRPNAHIGGPYVSISSYGNPSHMDKPGPKYPWGTIDQRTLDVIAYWLQHKHGAEFLTIDGYSGNDDKIWRTDAFSAGEKFADIIYWIRQQAHGGKTLPIWWAEWYTSLPDYAPTDLHYINALMASNEIRTLLSGATVPLIWGPQGDNNGFSEPEGLWTATQPANGGKSTPYYATTLAFHDYFGPGTQLYRTSSSSANLSVLASRQKIMLVNHLPAILYVSINGTIVKLDPYAVSLFSTPPKQR